MEKAEAKKTAKLPKLSLPKKKKHVETAPAEPAPLPICEVRPFDKKDYRTLSLLLNGFKNAVGEAPLTQLEWSALRKGIEEDRITYYIAWQGERAVGVFSLCRTFSSFRCAPVGLFEDFYVLPDVRGTGVARVLAQYARTAVESIGGKTLTVTCAECDREMYQSLGFTEPIGITLSQTL